MRRIIYEEMDNILISVIIPVYNSEKYISRCIKSVLSQSLGDFEIVAVDDGSVDSSLKILKQLSNTDDRLRVYSKENGGVSSARNYGISKAKGKFISFVDSDDTLPQNALEILYSNITDDIDLISGSYTVEGIVKKYCPHSNMRVTADEKLSRFTEYDHINWGPWGKFYRRELIDKYNIRFDETLTYGEDHIFNLSYTKIIKGDMVVVSDSVYIYNNKLRDNLCSRRIENIAYQLKTLFETILHYFDGAQIEKSVKYRYLYGTLTGAIDHYLVLFPKDRAIDNIAKTFEVYAQYIDEDFLAYGFSDSLSQCISKGDYTAFAELYENEHKGIGKRRIRNKIKGILVKIL